MDLPVLNDTTPLAFEIAANDRDGIRVELLTIGEAARFISTELIGERVTAVDWKHAAAALEEATRNPTFAKHATETVHALLKTEGMLSD